MRRKLHSLVVPVRDEEPVLDELYRRIAAEVGEPLSAVGEQHELVLVDDGSVDGSRDAIRDLHARDPAHVRLVALSRGFGHQNAVSAGIDHAVGDTVTVLDADLQDPPAVVLEMIERSREGWDVVYGVREKRRGESLVKRITAALYYRLMRRWTSPPIPVDSGDFRLLSRRAVDALKRMPEGHRFLRGLATWIGFRQTSVSYVRQPRHAGATKYSLAKMLRFAIDGLTGFSLAPLRVASWLGLAVSVAGAACTLFFLLRLLDGAEVDPLLLLLPVLLLLGGAQLLALGVLGEYVGRTLHETMRRPLYLVEETLGVEVADDGSTPGG